MSEHAVTQAQTVLAPFSDEQRHAALTEINQYLHVGLDGGASDIHLGTASQPIWRRFGILEAIKADAPKLAPSDTERMARGLTTDAQWRQILERGDADFAYQTDRCRFRASVVRQRHGLEMVFRIINTIVRTMDDLGMPPNLKMLTQYHNGLILVTGAVGSGKSTTLAAIMEEINRSRHDHIITLEDPIEYIFQPKGCHITQREVHLHTQSFSNALRASLREDPDIIMVGEMRDLETIQLAITASETGHLVLGTLHTSNASRTLDRLLDVFPLDQRDQIRVMVSESLRGIISQQLIPKKDGKGRVMAMEILTNSPAVGSCIREAKTFMLPGIIQTGKKLGMKLMDDSLLDLYDKGLISQEECYVRAEQKAMVKAHFGN